MKKRTMVVLVIVALFVLMVAVLAEKCSATTINGEDVPVVSSTNGDETMQEDMSGEGNLATDSASTAKQPIEPYVTRDQLEKDYMNRHQKNQGENPYDKTAETLKALEKSNQAFQAGLQGKVEALGAQVWNLSLSIENVTKKVNQRVDCLKKTVFDLHKIVDGIRLEITSLNSRTTQLEERTTQLEKRTTALEGKTNSTGFHLLLLYILLLIIVTLLVWIGRIFRSSKPASAEVVEVRNVPRTPREQVVNSPVEPGERN